VYLTGGPIVGYRKMWLRIAKEGELPSDITPPVLRHSFASYFPAQK
jgi:integrase